MYQQLMAHESNNSIQLVQNQVKRMCLFLNQTKLCNQVLGHHQILDRLTTIFQ